MDTVKTKEQLNALPIDVAANTIVGINEEFQKKVEGQNRQQGVETAQAADEFAKNLPVDAAPEDAGHFVEVNPAKETGITATPHEVKLVQETAAAMSSAGIAVEAAGQNAAHPTPETTIINLDTPKFKGSMNTEMRVNAAGPYVLNTTDTAAVDNIFEVRKQQLEVVKDNPGATRVDSILEPMVNFPGVRWIIEKFGLYN